MPRGSPRTLLTSACALVASAVCWVAIGTRPCQAQSDAARTVLEIEFTPTRNAQLAIWLERADGTFLSTVRLTDAVASRGIGNRPGALEMNSGFHWPYGRREGVLPIWASRRAAAPGAAQFRRVIFQNRASEGFASATSADSSVDDHFCLAWDQARSTRDALDAVSCASVFHSDKGRFITQAEVERTSPYVEPYEQLLDHAGVLRALSAFSLYPPRRDFTPCVNTRPGSCFDHLDAVGYASHVRSVMPEIDAVTMATPAGGVRQTLVQQLAPELDQGAFRLCLEINVEGDYNSSFNDRMEPTPHLPEMQWDVYAMEFGYPYRGQPSVVYCADFQTGDEIEHTITAAAPVGSAGGWDVTDPTYGQLHGMDGISDDPLNHPGSGADRLALQDGSRLLVHVKPPLTCRSDAPPSAVEAVQITPYPNPRHAYEWARLSFRAASDDLGISRYDVRVSRQPITDEASYLAGMPAQQATRAAEELLLATQTAAGVELEADFGGMLPATHYYIAVRAIDGCAHTGPLRVAEWDTQPRVFATVSPCFVATAAWGSPLAPQIGALRRFRDRHLLPNRAGRALVAAYYELGPSLANLLLEHPTLRAAARSVLSPVVRLARALDP